MKKGVAWMAEDILKEIDENEKKIEWTLEQLKPGASDQIRSGEAINLLDELENEKLELEKKETEKKVHSLPEKIALFYIRFFGSLFFVVLFIIFIAGWISLDYYLTATGQMTFTNITILNTVMIALAVLQMPFIMISLRMIQKKEREDESIGNERERLNIKLQTLNAEDLKVLDSEHTALREEHDDLRRSIDRMQDSLDKLNQNLGKMMHVHIEENKAIDEAAEQVFREDSEEDNIEGIRGRARIVDFEETINNLKKKRAEQKKSINRSDEKFEINEDFMNNFKKEINLLKKHEQRASKKTQKPKKSIKQLQKARDQKKEAAKKQPTKDKQEEKKAEKKKKPGKKLHNKQ